jgi:hypothetical protein
MRFSTATVLGLAASTFAAVLPRSELGSWAVSFSKASFANGLKSEDVTAVYTSDSYPEGITSKCTYTYTPWETPEESNSCDEGFTYSFDGQSAFPFS